MCSSVGLVVEGIPLGNGRQFAPRLTMKKEYNTRCFRPERYRHEVANHYRDYKLQQHLHQQQQQQQQLGSGAGSLGHRRHRRRRRQFFERTMEASRVTASLASRYAQFRDVWPTHVHYFPRSDDTAYASRGRRTVCSGAPPDDTYNDAVRRIRSAHSCEQLRHLVHRIPWQWSTCTGNDDLPPVATAHGSQTNHKLNINKRNPAAEESPQQQQLAAAVPQVDFYGYLQLASGYYERGLQANIKYLQSIGQQQRQCRNAIRSSPANLFTDSDAVQHGESPVRKLTGRLVQLLKSLRRRTAKEVADVPGIWVNIRAVKRGEQQQQEQEQQQELDLDSNSEEEEELNEEATAEWSTASMCDYYAPGYTTTESGGASARAATEATFVAQAQDQTTTTNTFTSTSTSTDQRRLYEIIDNLSHLGIGDTSSNSSSGNRREQLTLTLPQITLTDCTAQQVALYSASFDIVTLQIPNEARPPYLKA
ncbi:uncharacterized protein LOC108140903 [Drosophila elegans]|uniref:uncharacterized protein LOC108140903 n=1 Tax=Drosophila elegans TaxID=30023 RepID=UPI0007E8B2FA|nr:uncharacterized protein LOC108140903 [Drosophila elegans]